METNLYYSLVEYEVLILIWYLTEFTDSIKYFENILVRLKQNKTDFDFKDIHNITFNNLRIEGEPGFLEETFIYKSIIERFMNQIDFFDSLLKTLKEEKSTSIKLMNIKKIFKDLKDLKKIHMYLISISLNGFLNIKDKFTNISLINDHLNQINGSIKEIENKKKNVNKYLKKHESQGNFSKYEFLVFFNLHALQDLAYLKKEILEALLTFCSK